MSTSSTSPIAITVRMFLLGVGGTMAYMGGMLTRTLLAHPQSGESSAVVILFGVMVLLTAIGAGAVVLAVQGDGAYPGAEFTPAPRSRLLRVAMALAAAAIVAQVVGALLGEGPPWRASYQAHLVIWSYGFAAAVAGVQGLAMRRRFGWAALILTAPIVAALLIDDVTHAREWTPKAVLNAGAHLAQLVAAALCVCEVRWRWMLR
jgi:hypothetical protein